MRPLWLLIIAMNLAPVCEVAAKSGPGRFVLLGQGAAYDAATKLTWQRVAPSSPYTWPDANSYCLNNLAKLPGTGWRLPNIRELLSIVDRQEHDPAIDLAVFSLVKGWYWSASKAKPPKDFTMAWTVRYEPGLDVAGFDIDGPWATTARVRCVR